MHHIVIKCGCCDRCQVCHKKFAHSSVLAQHQSIHKNLKPHLCHQCGKSFTQKSQLKVHEKRHSGVKSHVCQFCDSSFTTRSKEYSRI